MCTWRLNLAASPTKAKVAVTGGVARQKNRGVVQWGGIEIFFFQIRFTAACGGPTCQRRKKMEIFTAATAADVG